MLPRARRDRARRGITRWQCRATRCGRGRRQDRAGDRGVHSPNRLSPLERNRSVSSTVRASPPGTATLRCVRTSFATHHRPQRWLMLWNTWAVVDGVCAVARIAARDRLANGNVYSARVQWLPRRASPAHVNRAETAACDPTVGPRERGPRLLHASSCARAHIALARCRPQHSPSTVMRFRSHICRTLFFFRAASIAAASPTGSACVRDGRARALSRLSPNDRRASHLASRFRGVIEAPTPHRLLPSVSTARTNADTAARATHTARRCPARLRNGL